jgi:hypothetical protein
MTHTRFVPAAVAAVAAGFAASSCSSGGEDTVVVVNGLAPPAQIQVVTAEPVAPLAAAVPSFPAGSDYATDESFQHVFDPSMEAIETVNEILCMITQTAADRMVNYGPYNAQVDESLCDTGSDPSGSSTGQSSGGNAVAPEIWVVDSRRSDNDSPQVVDVWVPNDEDGVTGEILARMAISEGASDANPFGDFFLDFAMVPDGGTLADPTFTGTLETVDRATGDLGFSFYEAYGDPTQVPNPGEWAEIRAVTVTSDAATDGGSARLNRAFRFNDPFFGDSGLQQEEFQLDFDADFVLRGRDADPAVCLSRTDFHVNTWRYNLYHASGVSAGERVDLESGFPFVTATGERGWLGYWGLWVEGGASVSNGDTITRHEFGSQTSADYTVVSAPGKLIEHTRNTLDLADAEGVRCEWWWFDPQGGQPPSRFLVEIQSSLFYKIATWDDATQAWVDLPGPELIDTASLGFLSMWSQGLGGQVSYVHGDLYLTYYEERFVNGADALFGGVPGTTITLYGFVDCLRSGITAAEAEMGDVRLPNAPDVATPYEFEFSDTDLTLWHDTDGSGLNLTRVGLADGEEPQSGPNMWGMRSGPMVTDTSGLANVWDVWSQPIFYTYETGHNPWNRYTTAVDMNGAYVVFDPPIQFTYTHATAADANGDATYDGRKFLLGYGGDGNLWGIPHTGLDFDGDGNFDRFVPEFSILDGTLMGPSGDEYVIRAIDSELTLEEDPAGCGGLDLADAAALVLPDGSSYTAPNIGAKPLVTDPPAVIAGRVQ